MVNEQVDFVVVHRNVLEKDESIFIFGTFVDFTSFLGLKRLSEKRLSG